jgi:hypothetical protein
VPGIIKFAKYLCLLSVNNFKTVHPTKCAIVHFVASVKEYIGSEMHEMDNLKETFQPSMETEFNVRKRLVLTAILISILKLTIILQFNFMIMKQTRK